MLVDNFQFGNHSDYFFNGVDSNITPSLEKKASYPSGTLGYYISDKLYNNLTKGMSDKTKAYLNLKMSSMFEGACFGMSNLAGLIYDGKIKLSSFSTSAKTTYELNYPTSNKNLASALAYYHLLQNRKEIGSLLSTSTTNGEYYAKQIVNTCSNKQDGDILGVIGFNIVGTGDHAVLAYKYDKTVTGHDITIYDPNYPNKEGHLLISDDYKNASVTNYNQIVLQGISDLCLCDEDYLIRNMMGIDDSSNVIIMIGSENAKVKVGNSSVTVANGHISNINGDIAAETIDGQTIIVSDDDSEDIDVETDGNIAIIDDNEAVNANGDGKVSVSKSGDDVEVNSNGNSQVEFITNYKKSGGLVRVTTYVPNLKVRKKNNNSLQIETSNNSKVKVEVGNVDGVKYNVDEVDTSKNAEITINDSNVEVKENGTVVKTVTEQGVQQPVLDQPIDVSQISNKSKEKAKDFSQRLIERIKSKNDTITKFKNKGYRHSTWAEDEVARADELGIIPYSIINKLQSNITRKEFCEIAYQTVKSLTGMTDTEMKAFCSTPDSSNPYAYQYSDTAISFAYGTGIVNGYPDGSFGPNDLITRAQAAKMLVVTAEIMGKITSESGAKRFNDNPNDWSQTYINKISSIISPYTSNRVMGGDDRGNFMPLANYTCEQAVLTMERLIENVIGENANYNGGTVKAEETKPQTFVPSDNDQTYFTPKGWSWTREGSEGYNRKYFTSGKYVREDGRAVLYVESSDSPDFFAYQLYALPEGAKQSSYESYKSSGNWSYAENTTQTGAYDEQSQLYF
ncbi:MAG: S-layer homology domain-containing protein [Clostridia bacterium]|nr:S-layer homology domain-containing protein [Clostridia bacterium]